MKNQNTIAYNTEYTDTFNGDANYSWVKRASFEAPDNASNRQLINRAKKALDVIAPFRMDWDGEDLRYNEQGACRCLFISASY